MNGIIFDLDGTLWKATDTTLESANIIAHKYGTAPVTKEAVEGGMGLQLAGCAALYFPNEPEELAVRYMNEVNELNNKVLATRGAYLFPYLEPVLKQLSEKYQLFIVSNTSRQAYIDAFINTSMLGKYFTETVAAGILGLPKSEAIKKVIRDHNLVKSVYIGDTAGDQQAAAGAGIPFIQMLYGFGPDLGERFKAHNFEEVPGLVEQALN